MSRAMLRSMGTLFAASMAGLCLSCSSSPSAGWSFSSTFDQSIGSVAITMFDNRTFYIGVEQELAEALVAEVQRRSPWRVAGPEEADSTLSGTVSSVSLGALSSRPGTGLVQEQTLTITVDFEWRNTLTGEVLASRERFSAASLFVPSAPTGERIDRGRREAVEELAEAIVGEMRGQW